MITRRRVKKLMRKNKLRRKHRRNIRKKDKDILPIILIVLLIINIVGFLYLVNSGDIDKDITTLDLVLDTLNIKKISAQKIDTPLQSNPEDRDGFKLDDERIIEHLEEYENLIIVEKGDSNLDNIPEPVNVEKFTVDKTKEYILAYHTHTTESFLADNGKFYDSDPSKNVVAIGNTISTVLEAKGHKIKHDSTVHNLPSFNQSYSRSKNTIIKYKEENSNLRVFLDIHRDGREKNSSDLDKFIKAGRIDIDGVSNATFSLVVGPDAENYEEVLSFAKYVKAVSDTMYPGLCKGIIVKPIGKYNLQFSNYSALLEMGSNWTTLEETIETGKKVGEILSIVLDMLIVE